MKVEVCKNIDLVQIDITAGKSEYRLPRNVDWANRKVDKLLLVAPEKGCLSPLDGITPVLTRTQIEDLYFDLFRADESEIAQNLYFENLLYTNNHPVRIDSVMSLKQARLNFSTPPTESGCILLYVFWGGSINDDFQMPTKSETVTFDLAANEKMTFTEIINTYFHVRGEKIRGIQVCGSEENPAYLTLRDHDLTYVLNNVLTVLARPEMQGATPEQAPLQPIWLDSIDIDFDYSFILNATDEDEIITITFTY